MASVSPAKARRASDMKHELVEAVVDAAPGRGPFSSRERLAAYLRLYYVNVAVDDLETVSPENLAGAAVAHLELAQRRRRGRHLLRIYNPERKRDGWESSHTIIEVVNDDMPFLVDSISMTVTRAGLAIHLTVHPLLRLERDADGQLERVHDHDSDRGRVESFVRMEVDRETGAGALAKLERSINATLRDVRAAVRDWRAMRQQMLEAADRLEHNAPGRIDDTLLAESRRFLHWMAEDHFTYLGYREYEIVRSAEGDCLAPVAGTGLGLLAGRRHEKKSVPLTPEMRRQTRNRDALIITKANARSTVHRPSYLDYVGVKVYDEEGRAVREQRFLGLFTSVAYSESPRNIPLLRYKVGRVMERSGLDPQSHRGKALMHILDTFPRDELLQSSVQDLSRTTAGVLNIQERRLVKFFIRRDGFRRFFSCIVFVPREQYTTQVRHRIEAILREAFEGVAIDSSVQLSESVLARLHIIVRTHPGARPRVSIREIERRIEAACVTWRDKLKRALIEREGEECGLALFRRLGEAFPAAYEEDIDPQDACDDVKRLARLIDGEGTVAERCLLYRPPEPSAPSRVHFKVLHSGRPLVLSEVLPTLENLGVEAINERPYHLRTESEGADWWLHDFELDYPQADALDFDTDGERFRRCFDEVTAGRIENDGYNRLVLGAALTGREVTVLRTYGKYLQQLGVPFSQPYMEEALSRHPEFAATMVEVFRLRFDPALESDEEEADRLDEGLRLLKRHIEAAKTLDEDRMLTAYAGVLTASLRTSYFRAGDDGEPRPALAIKFDPSRIAEAPQPRPRYEIFVYSPRVEGVHLRAGEIARGGIRWSDRREDFRTEVLGLMKAQTVKNTVIVPTGAKGGFFPKRLPAGGDRDAVQQEVVACYRLFIGSLLDVTDNIVDAQVVPPPDVRRHDGDDPYLVVAADKGTAAFSDIANEIAAERRFWLGDAFASGGSAGYDHKKMGITARGGWEAVKRHFRELGLDTQSQPFTVCGIGDMSGDVFGNGMLLSKTIRLVAAFNHRHIFLDPDPDPEASWRERRRLFRLPRSGWEDYDEALISEGGGVHSRDAKRIALTPEVRELVGVEEKELSPPELIRALLRMSVDLLWNGGIGTYVKASAESQLEAGDRSNDAVRVDADELGCKVVGEGGNLGLTQQARIEFALRGGKINTDFIDNSAGVDSSDREVNIKILLNQLSDARGLTRKARDKLLADMTDEVAELVLRNNYLQTQAISMVETRARERLREHARFLQLLEGRGLIDRELEALPDESAIEERRTDGVGLTRPEISLLLSFSKIELYGDLIAQGEFTDAYLARELAQYFPTRLRRRCRELIPEHRLAHEILAMMVTNSIVNRMGPVFARRAREETGASVTLIAKAYTVAREICGARELWRQIEALDNEVPAGTQYSMMFDVARHLRHACYWLIRRHGEDLAIGAVIEAMQPGMGRFFRGLRGNLTGSARQRLETSTSSHESLGVGEPLARQMAALNATLSGLDIVDVARELDADGKRVARLYYEIGRGLHLDWLRHMVDGLKVDGYWQALARANLRDSLHDTQRTLTAELLADHPDASPADTLYEWLESEGARVKRARELIAEMRKSRRSDFATLSVAADELRKLCNA